MNRDEKLLRLIRNKIAEKGADPNDDDAVRAALSGCVAARQLIRVWFRNKEKEKAQ